MRCVPDTILSFADVVVHGYEQYWGRKWTTREIDGLFYNEFLNESFQEGLRQLRKEHFGQEAPPQPCRWDGPGADKVLIPPFGNAKDEIYDGNAPVLGRLAGMVDEYCIPYAYAHGAVLHGTPAAFERVNTYWGTTWSEEQSWEELFVVDLYDRRATKPDWNRVIELYEKFLLGSKLRRQDSETMGARVDGAVTSDGVPAIKIRAWFPFGSPKAFLQHCKDALNAKKDQLPVPGESRRGHQILAWTVYLLNTLCGMGNQAAILMGNNHLGGHLRSYNMPSKGAKLRGDSVTTRGEEQYAGDKAEIKMRIEHYTRTFTQRIRGAMFLWDEKFT